MENIQHKHTQADDIASAKADEAFNQGKWEEFTGAELLSSPEANNDSRYPAFYQTSDERITLGAEQLEAGSQAYNGLFDDLMLQGMDDVKRFESIKDRPTASLLRHIEVDGQKYTLALRDKGTSDPNDNTHGISFRDSETITREISLQIIDDGRGREYWSYRLGADGVVRRWDGGDFTAKRQKERELGIEGPEMLSEGATIEEIGKTALTGIKSITEGIPNSRLEEDMGLNNQPASPDEIQGLQDFLSRAIDSPR